MKSVRPTTSLQRHGTWYSFDAPYERLQLFSPWTIAGFGAAVGLGLMLVYPHKTLSERLAASEQNEQPDRLTVEYLKVFIKAEPKANELRMSLARQLIRLGSYDEARNALAPLANHADPVWKMESAWLELEIREQEAFAAPDPSAKRVALLAVMRSQLRTVLSLPQSAERLIALGRKALAAGDAQVAASAFQRVAAGSDQLPGIIYLEAAQATLGLGDYRTSATLYFKAMTHTTTFALRRDYFLEGLRTLQAGSLFDEAIAAADRYLAFPDETGPGCE
jgi:polysaccharide biosynthesis protein PelB